MDARDGSYDGSFAMLVRSKGLQPVAEVDESVRNQIVAAARAAGIRVYELQYFSETKQQPVHRLDLDTDWSFANKLLIQARHK